ncbi:MAG: glycoside hydrolase family 3 N-terminal domain-containing protein [Pseudomonadota bacterium]
MTSSPTLTEREQARRIAARLLMVRIEGTRLDAHTRQWLRESGIRAVCLFRQNMREAQELAQLTAELRALMGPEALIAIDQEGGAVVRAHWLPGPPSAMALGAAGDPALARAVGAAVARGVRSLGFNWNFAPVLDLNNNLENPVIAERSFGADPRLATPIALAWMEGSLAEGVACCVKHAPGHGDTHVDSHRALPTVAKTRAELEALEFAPFAQAAASAPAMMTAHIVYPALDPAHPATLSHPILTGLIRGQWQYRGVIITDSMDMQAIAGTYGVGTAAAMALQAGADMVMALGDMAAQAASLGAMAELIAAGTLATAQAQERVARLDALARRFPCAAPPYLSEAADQELMRAAWLRGLTAWRAPRRPAPGARLRLVVRADAASDGVSEAGLSGSELAAQLGAHFDVATTVFDDPEQFDWSSLPADGRTVVLASTTRKRYGPLARARFTPQLHLALWNPFQALDIDAPALISYGHAAGALAAVLAWLTGQAEAHGVHPCLGEGAHT